MLMFEIKLLSTAIRRHLCVCSSVVMDPITPSSQTQICSTTDSPVFNIYFLNKLLKLTQILQNGF